MSEELQTLYKEYSEVNLDLVIKAGDTVSFADVEEKIRTINKWFFEFYEAEEYRQNLPNANYETIKREFSNAVAQFRQIMTMRDSDKSGLINQRDAFAGIIINYYSSLYDNFDKDFRTWEISNQDSSKLQKELNSIVKKTQKYAEQIKASAEAAGSATTQLSMNQLAKYFNELVVGDYTANKNHSTFRNWIRKNRIGYAGVAKIWLVSVLVSIIINSVLAWVLLYPLIPNLTDFKNLPENPSAIFGLIIVKSLILIGPLYLIRFCVKNYNANKHLATDALHRAKVLQTLEAYIGVVRNDPVALKEITVTTATMIFAPPTSGFISHKDEIMQIPNITIPGVRSS